MQVICQEQTGEVNQTVGMPRSFSEREAGRRRLSNPSKVGTVVMAKREWMVEPAPMDNEVIRQPVVAVV